MTRRAAFSPVRRAPWPPEDDAKLIDLMQLGVCVEAYKPTLPARRMGDILERRLELREAGHKMAAVI